MLFLRRAAVAGAGAGARRFAGAGVEVGGRERLRRGPGLQEFLRAGQAAPGGEAPAPAPYLPAPRAHQRKVSLEVFGCQMNVSDTEVVWSILKDAGFQRAEGTDADVYLVMTCAIREGAETKIWKRLEHLRGIKNRRAQSKQRLNPVKIGILGCMAERLKEKLLEKEKSVDIVAGPDSYRDLPRLLELTDNNQTAVNVLLSLDETYADVVPVRLNQDCVTAFVYDAQVAVAVELPSDTANFTTWGEVPAERRTIVSIMRGCDNMCTYCIVPFTRGRERSRPITSIVDEVKQLSEQGVREITLLGQNVNSYRDISQVTEPAETRVVDGFRTVYKKKKGGLRFADLLDKVSSVDPEMRIRFTSPHPKDFPDEVLHIISERSNICKMLHLPAQSGSSAVLERMRRGYTREAYLALVQHVRDILPGVGLSSDFICGFCGETDEQFEETLTLMDIVNYNVAYLFPYSMREKTTAHRRYDDDVSDATKRERHLHMNQLFRRKADILNRSEIGNTHLVLIEGNSKKSEQFLVGRNEHNIKVIVPQMEVEQIGNNFKRQMKPGDYVAVDITDANWLVMKGTPLFYSSISSFYNYNNEGRIRKTL